jgi:hypothetical protein
MQDVVYTLPLLNSTLYNYLTLLNSMLPLHYFTTLYITLNHLK